MSAEPVPDAVRLVQAWAARDFASALASRRGWNPVSRLGPALGLRGRDLIAAARSAERAGLADVQDRPSGVWAKLSALGRSLYRPAPGARREVNPSDLEDDGHAELLAEVANWPAVVVPAEALAARLGRDVDDVWDALASAERAGWVELWHDAPASPSAVLSPLAARRLRLRASADGSIWLRPGEPDPTSIDARDPAAAETDCSADGGPGIIDSMPDPDAIQGAEWLARCEEAAGAMAEIEAGREAAGPGPAAPVARAWRDSAECHEAALLPQPRMILGLGLPWPPARAGSKTCPGCGGARLPSIAYCLVCHRSGVDHLIPETAPLPLDRKPGPARRAGRKLTRKERRSG